MWHNLVSLTHVHVTASTIILRLYLCYFWWGSVSCAVCPPVCLTVSRIIQEVMLHIDEICGIGKLHIKQVLIKLRKIRANVCVKSYSFRQRLVVGWYKKWNYGNQSYWKNFKLKYLLLTDHDSVLSSVWWGGGMHSSECRLQRVDSVRKRKQKDNSINWRRKKSIMRNRCTIPVVNRQQLKPMEQTATKWIEWYFTSQMYQMLDDEEMGLRIMYEQWDSESLFSCCLLEGKEKELGSMIQI